MISFYRRVIILLVVALGWQNQAYGEEVQSKLKTPNREYLALDRKPRKSKKRSRRKSREHLNRNQAQFKFGVGLSLGSEASLGNGVSLHYLPLPIIDLEAGVGFNSSGLKTGIAATGLLSVHPQVNLAFGVVGAYSGGRSNATVQLDNIKFTPEGAAIAENITATKTYSVSSAVFLGARLGAIYKLTSQLLLQGYGNYNLVFSGNEVTFDDGISFSPDVEVTNQDQFDQQFQERAKEDVAAGGLGFSIGIIYLL